MNAASTPSGRFRCKPPRVPQVLDAQAPVALHLEAYASIDAMETMARAEARLLKSAETFFEPLFRVSVLDNLGRKEDPFAEPGDGERYSSSGWGACAGSQQTNNTVCSSTELGSCDISTNICRSVYPSVSQLDVRYVSASVYRETSLSLVSCDRGVHTFTSYMAPTPNGNAYVQVLESPVSIQSSAPQYQRRRR